MDALYAICATYSIDDGQAAGFVLMRKEPDGGAKPWPILITRKGNKFFGSRMPARIKAHAWTRRPESSWTRKAILSPAENIMRSSIRTPAIALSDLARARR